MLARVRRVELIEDRQLRARKNGPQLRELEKTFVTVVLAHAARADATERQIVLRDVQHAVVDGNAARDRRIQELALRRAVVREHVEAERTILRVDVRNYLVECLVSLHRKQRTEDL